MIGQRTPAQNLAGFLILRELVICENSLAGALTTVSSLLFLPSLLCIIKTSFGKAKKANSDFAISQSGHCIFMRCLNQSLSNTKVRSLMKSFRSEVLPDATKWDSPLGRGRRF